MKALHAKTVFDGHSLLRDRVVLLQGATIVALLAPGALPPGVPVEVLPEGTLLAPGLVDLQVNGGGGVLFSDAVHLDALHHIGAAHAAAGTTSWLPTLISPSRQTMAQARAVAAEAATDSEAGILGLHFEGPFLAPSRRGIHPESALLAMQAADLDALCVPCALPLVLTLAPERVPPAAITRLARAGVRLFAGHSEACYAAAMAGFDAGVLGVMHLFNAMSGFLPRAPGLVGAALDRRAVWAGLIADGVHVHDAAVRLAFAAKGPARLFLVSDAMGPAASEVGEFCFAGTRIRREGGRLQTPDGRLAGSAHTLAEVLRHAVREAGLPLAAALRMATRTPARLLGRAERGRIGPGARADLVAFDTDLRPMAVWQGGERRR